MGKKTQTKPYALGSISLATDDAEPNNDQDLLLSAIHHLTTFHRDDCSDILLCADEPLWDNTMDDALCNILSCTVESVRDNSPSQSQAADIGGEASTTNEHKDAKEVAVAEGKYRDLISLYTLRDPACMSVPAMSSIDSVSSIASDSFCSTSSLDSHSLTSRTRTRKMSPKSNAEWAIMELAI